MHCTNQRNAFNSVTFPNIIICSSVVAFVITLSIKKNNGHYD